jgi:hypothetical protein
LTVAFVPAVIFKTTQYCVPSVRAEVAEKPEHAFQPAPVGEQVDEPVSISEPGAPFVSEYSTAVIVGDDETAET